IRGDRIDGAALHSEVHVAGIAPGADDVRAGPRLLEGQRERPADQADADDRDSLEEHQSLRLAASAAKNFSFSSGVPIVTRKCSGSPSPPPTGRTITLRRSRR